MEPSKIILFHNHQIRRTLHHGEWWFSIVDVIAILADTDRPRKYWSDLKVKLITEGYSEVSEKIGQLKMMAPDGKKRRDILMIGSKKECVGSLSAKS